MLLQPYDLLTKPIEMYQTELTESARNSEREKGREREIERQRKKRERGIESKKEGDCRIDKVHYTYPRGRVGDRWGTRYHHLESMFGGLR